MSRYIFFPFEIGQTVYKICPKCNDNHIGSCKNCAWNGCFSHGCDVGVRIWQDGSYNNSPKQIVPRIVSTHNFFTIKEHWNTMFFETVEQAEQAIKEYDLICQTPNREERYRKYKEWHFNREQAIRELETADAEPVRHGKWVVNGSALVNPQCSKCKNYSIAGKTNYCPNCGARMDGEGK